MAYSAKLSMTPSRISDSNIGQWELLVLIVKMTHDSRGRISRTKYYSVNILISTVLFYKSLFPRREIPIR